MEDYRPIPGGRAVDNIPIEDDLTRLASQRASNLLLPYQERFGLKPVIPNPAAPNVATPTPAMGLEDKLYQSVHPDTFSRVMETIMHMVTGRPIPRQFGGTVEPEEEYIVGERGPERFRPAVPGTVYPGSPPLTYTGAPTLREGARERMGRRMPGREGAPTEPFQIPSMGIEPGAGGRLYEETLGPWAETAGRAWRGLGRGAERLIGPSIERGIVNPLAYITTGRRPPPIDWMGEGGALTPGITPGETLLSSRGEIPMRPPPSPPGRPETPPPAGEEEGWLTYGAPEEGMRYKVGAERFFLGGEEVPAGTPGAVSGDVMARERLFRETPGEGYPIPERGYYDVHPEERRAQEIYDMFRGPSPGSYEAGVERMREMNLMDIANQGATKEARAAAAEQLTNLRTLRATREENARKAAADIYGQALQYGPETPVGQERLAHAEYFRRMPEVQWAGQTMQSMAHLEGINRQVAGQLEVARIGADTKNQMMKDIGTVLSEGYKNQAMGMGTFDPTRAISTILQLYRSTGRISDEQWAAFPEEWRGRQWTEQTLRADLAAHGMNEKDIAAYITRAKATGRI